MRESLEKLINTLDLRGLRALWVSTDNMADVDIKYTIRELAIKRLEAVFPANFEAWLYQDNSNDFSVFYR